MKKTLSNNFFKFKKSFQSDVGFHNMLKNKNLFFIDFEYAEDNFKIYFRLDTTT